MANVKGNSNIQGVPGVYGENTANGDGVVGQGWRGVVGTSDKFQGVYGKSTDNAGVVGESEHLHGVYGVCHNPHGAGVYGTNDQVGGFGIQGVNPSGDGVIGTGRRGVVGESATFQGVYGHSTDNAGVVGESEHLHGVYGVCHNPNGAGVFGTNDQVGDSVSRGLIPQAMALSAQEEEALSARVTHIKGSTDLAGIMRASSVKAPRCMLYSGSPIPLSRESLALAMRAAME